MHTPSAHIIRQGAADTISGASPTAVSQSQPTERPGPVTANPATARTRRSPIQDRKLPARLCVGEPDGGFAISMLCILSLHMLATRMVDDLTRTLRELRRCRAANTLFIYRHPRSWLIDHASSSRSAT